jgi:hypothetical protein
MLIATASLSSVVLAQAPAQVPPSKPGVPNAGPITPLEVRVVVSRYDGDKRVSSLPYVLAVNANDGNIDAFGRFQPFSVARLRTGAEVPVPQVKFARPPKDTSTQGPLGPVEYKAIGTNIDCWARSIDDGRFSIEISIEDSSVYADGQTAQGVAVIPDIPSFRHFKTNTSVLLKDRQTVQFTAAADRITGEITRVDVTLSVVK